MEKNLHPLRFRLRKLLFGIVAIFSLTNISYAQIDLASAKDLVLNKPRKQLDVHININLQNADVNKLLVAIEEKSDFKFVYDKSILGYKHQFNINEKRISLYNLFQKISGESDLRFKQVNNNVNVRLLERNQEKDSSKIVDVTITGTVVNQNGEPIPGATVSIPGTGIGTATDLAGEYTISVPEGSTLVFSFIGYVTQQIVVVGQSKINIQLEEDISSLDEVVVVGYGTQKKSSVTSAISSVSGRELTKAPVANISNSLAGRLPGVISTQPSGEPGSDADNIRIRGIGTLGNANPLVIVDGVPRDYNQINPNEIESITVLKDAAAVAPYGLGGANGVILVTTKRGKEGKVSLGYNGWYGVQQPTNYPKYLDAYGYANLLNVANENIGNEAPYSEEELQKFRDGSDPNHYPNTNWVNDVLNLTAPMTSHNLTFAGGSDKVRFFSSLGYLFQEGVVSSINYKRYNLAANIDADVTSTTTVSLDLKGSLEKKQLPGGASGTSIFTDVTKNPPILPLLFDNGLPGTPTLPQIYESGYNRTNSNILYSQFSVSQKIPFVTGLALKGTFAYDKLYSFNKDWTLPVTFYALNAQDEFIPQYAGPPTPTLSQAFDQNEKTTLQGYLTYSRSFGKHHIDALAVYERRNGVGNEFSASRIGYMVRLDELSLGSSNKEDFDNAGSSNENAQIGWIYRGSYNYAEKYLLELAGRYDGHYYFAPGERFVFFPAVSMGWQLSEENFIRDNLDWVNLLKIRGSYGKSGNLAGGPFQYLTSYGMNTSYIFGGPQPYQVQGVFERQEANKTITWETAKKLNVGLEGLLFQGKLGFELDFFKERRSDMLISPSVTVPVEYGIGISEENAGIMENKGLELAVNTNFEYPNGLVISAGINVSHAKNKFIETFENESTYNNLRRRRTGRPLGTLFGYKALGFFQSDDEAKGWATQFGEVTAGDIKYEDVNGDGKIDPNDEVVIGKSSFPETIFGLNASVNWRGFDFSMLWQGATGVSFYLQDDAAYAFFNGAKVQDLHLDHWTPENRDARYPRITPSPTTNITQPSSFWARDASYLRLKTLEIGYSLPQSVLERIKLNAVRVFLSGQNVFTFSSIKNFDPGVSNNKGRYYFQQRVLSAGLNFNL